MENAWTVVTGATGSMGAVAVRRMAAEGYPVVMACRNLEKGEQLRTRILTEQKDAVLELMELDLASRASVRSFVEALGGRPIAALFNNAGVLSRRYVKTEDGIEQTFAVNYLNTSLLTRLLVPFMVDGGNVVNMVSLTCKLSRLDMGWQELGEREFSQIGTYGKTKLALLYFSIELARRNPQLHVNVSDPGIVNSNMISMDRWFDPLADIFFRPFIKSPEKGAEPALRALHCNDSLRYFVGRRSGMIPARFLKSKMPDSLWNQANELLGM